MRPGSSHLFVLTVLCAGAGVACKPSSPFVHAPAEDAGAPVAAYADQVLTLQQNGMLTSCASDFPDCQLRVAQDPSCPGDAFQALVVDGALFDLGPNGRLVVGFYCSEILETGIADGAVSASNDFYVYATVEGGASPVVEVSSDATNYFALNQWQLDDGGSKAGFQLEKASLPLARYVRISNAAGVGVIHIDGVQALRSLPLAPVGP